MAVELQIATNSSGYVESPPGFLSFPDTLTEAPSGSGLYLIPPEFDETSPDSGLYSLPASFNPDSLLGGQRSNIKGFSVQEDATPIDPGSSAGGVGQITVNVNENPESYSLIQEVITLSDRSTGKVQGTVRNISTSNGDATVVADSVLGLFNSDHIVPPKVGTLGAVFQSYCDIVGIVNDVTVDASIASRPVTYPGWVGNMWVHIKQLLAKEQVELALVFNRVVMRPLRQVEVNAERESSRSASVDNQNTAKKVEINYYNNVYGNQIEVYPLTTDEPTIYQVDAGETITISVSLNASMMSLNQPTCINFVEDRPYPGTNGVYSVSGNDGLPITAAQWTAQGGSVTVALTEDPSVMEITITGASMTDYAPYRIAMSAGTSSYYNSLHITGEGIQQEIKTLTLVTGATSAVTGNEVGITVDNPFISSLADAYKAGIHTAKNYAGRWTISGSAYNLNRPDDSREFISATVADFNALYPGGMTVAEFNVLWAGKTIADFNAYWDEQFESLWLNQAFGNLSGARVKRGDAYFRVLSATTTAEGTSYSAELDTIVSDFNPVWDGATVDDFNEQWAGKLMKDFTIIPLRRS
jgi:hypothetical protein